VEQRRICSRASSADMVLAKAQARDKTISKEDILDAYPLKERSLSNLCNVLHTCIIAIIRIIQ